MDVATQIEGAASSHPFLAKVFLILAVIVVFKLWPIIGPIVKAAWAWITAIKVPSLNPPAPTSPATAQSRVAAIQTLIADAMASGDNQALDNIVAVAKGYQKTATKEATAP